MALEGSPLYKCSFLARLDIGLIPSLGVEKVDCRNSVQLTGK